MAVDEEAIQRVLDREEGRQKISMEDLGEHEVTIESTWDHLHYRVTGYVSEPDDIFFIEIKAEDPHGYTQFCLNYEGGGIWVKDDGIDDDTGKTLEELLIENLQGPQVPSEKLTREVIFFKVLIEKAIPLMHMMRKDVLGS